MLVICTINKFSSESGNKLAFLYFDCGMISTTAPYQVHPMVMASTVGTFSLVCTSMQIHWSYIILLWIIPIQLVMRGL